MDWPTGLVGAAVVGFFLYQEWKHVKLRGAAERAVLACESEIGRLRRAILAGADEGVWRRDVWESERQKLLEALDDYRRVASRGKHGAWVAAVPSFQDEAEWARALGLRRVYAEGESAALRDSVGTAVVLPTNSGDHRGEVKAEVYRCRVSLDELQQTQQPGVFHCGQCQMPVYRVEDREGFSRAVAARRCVAVVPPNGTGAPELLGMPDWGDR